ncbi:MAG: hypothetical protein QOE52_5731 [Mycobacterium sp.]|nr:hypothetical protein [Mycobacterium sp.]
MHRLAGNGACSTGASSCVGEWLGICGGTLPVPRRIRIRRIRIAREGVAARIPRGPMTLSPGVSHPSLSPAGVIGPPVCREHGTGSCPMAGRVVMARPSRSAWSPIHGPSERIHLMNRRDVSACWRSNSKQVATTQNTDQHELSASNAESKHIGARPLKNTQYFTVLDDRSPAEIFTQLPTSTTVPMLQ